VSTGLNRLIQEYRSMLKAPEIEEILDLVLFRPIAFVIVKLLQPTRITPNHVTLFSFLPGLASGWCFWQGTPEFFLYGSILLFFTNVLDCVDGMLARIRGTGSLVGYVLDGLVDYVTQIFLIIGVIHGMAVLTGQPLYIMAIGIPAGFSFAWWSAMLDRIRNEWLDRVYGKRRDPAVELQELRQQTAIWKAEKSHRPERALIAIYAGYAKFWYSGPVQRKIVDRNSIPLDSWIAARRPILSMAALMGPTMHLSLIMLGGVFNKLEWYLWFALVFGSSWGILVLTTRAVIDHRLAVRLEKGV
jgi:phosphatidylglycerophosphate synthase